MRKVLYILSEFTDQDIDWIIGAGVRENVTLGQTLIQQGQRIEHLQVVLSGRCEVVVDQKSIADLSAGEMVGELSFVDSRPPVASVIVKESGSVLTIPASRLRSKLRTDTGFASRFYRGLAIFLSARLRDTVDQLAYSKGRLNEDDDDGDETGELPLEMLESLSRAAVKFEDILSRTKQA